MTLLQVVGGARPYFGAHSRTVFFAISLPFLAAACRGCDDKTPAPPPPAAAAKADLRAGLPQAGSLDAQLAAEQAARLHDADTVTFEQLKAALEPQGITFNAAHQLMGRTQLALFCAQAEGSEGLIVTVCEYPSAAAAQNGERETNLVQSKVEGHRSRVHQKSVLHLIRRSMTTDATVEKVLAVFASLPSSDAGP